MGETDNDSGNRFATSEETSELRDVDDFMLSRKDDVRETDNDAGNRFATDMEDRSGVSNDNDEHMSSMRVFYESEEEEKEEATPFNGISLSDYIKMKGGKYISDDMSVISFGVSKLQQTESNLYNRILEIQGRRS